MLGERLFSRLITINDGKTFLSGNKSLIKGGGLNWLYNRKMERSSCLPKPVMAGKIMGYRFLLMFAKQNTPANPMHRTTAVLNQVAN